MVISLNIYSERPFLCIICKNINLVLFSPHKRKGFHAPHTQTCIHAHIHRFLHNQPLVFHVRLYGLFNNSDDITERHNVAVKCQEDFAPFQVHSFRTHSCMYRVVLKDGLNHKAIFTKSALVKRHWFIYSHVVNRITRGGTNPDMSP